MLISVTPGSGDAFSDCLGGIEYVDPDVRFDLPRILRVRVHGLDIQPTSGRW